MKKLTTLLALLLAFAVFALMAMGSGSSDDGQTVLTGDGQAVATGGGNTENGQTGTENNTPPSQNTEEITIQEQLLLERDGVKITAKEYVHDAIWGDGIKLLIENNSTQNLGIGCDALIVNHYMISDLFAASVAQGKKANETVYLSSSALEAAGILNVGQIELYFHAYDSDSYDTVFDGAGAVIQTSAFEAMDTTPNDSGIELYNKGGIRIVGKIVDENSFWGTAVLLYLENNTGKNLTFSCENMSINGFMVSPFFASTVYDGKMAIDEITVFSSDLEENDITSIETVELAFHIYNTDTFETVTDTEPLSFSVK